jgi:hypothetical protein
MPIEDLAHLVSPSGAAVTSRLLSPNPASDRRQARAMDCAFHLNDGRREPARGRCLTLDHRLDLVP